MCSERDRHDLRGLKVGLVAERADEEPRRFTSVALQFTVTGNVPPEPIQRAIDLSREKYCSVWHSLRQDIELTATFTVVSAARLDRGQTDDIDTRLRS